MHWNFGYGWGMGMGLGCFLVLVFWVLVILGFIYLIKMILGGKGEQGGESKVIGPDKPLEIIKIRYAKGEITREEFEKMKEDLKRE